MVHAVRVVADEGRPPLRDGLAAEVVEARPVVVREEFPREAGGRLRHVVRAVRERPPGDGDAARAAEVDEAAAQDVARRVGVAARDEPGDAPHPRRGLVEDAAGMAHPGAAEVGAPGGEEVRGLAARRVAVEEEAARRGAEPRGEDGERVEEGAPRPRPGLPVGVVPEGRRNEDDAVQVGPRRPAELPGDLGAAVAVASAEEDEDAPPLPARRVVAAREAVPELRARIVRRARRDLDARDHGLRGRGGGNRGEGRHEEKRRQSSAHATGTPSTR